MPGRCCMRPIAKIIKVADFEAGITGLEEAFRNVSNSRVEDEEELKQDLLFWIKEFGNYVTRSHEEDYKQALLTEYRKFCANLRSENQELADALKKVKRYT